MSRICITGSSGFIGKALLKRLHQQGHKIRVFTRNPEIVDQSRYEVFQGDLCAPSILLGKFLLDCDVLIHCAGEKSDTAKMHTLHVNGTKKLLDAVTIEMKRSGRALHWVQLSSCGAYGPPPSGRTAVERVITEASSLHPMNEYEKTKAASDSLVIEAGLNAKMTFSILRPSNVIDESLVGHPIFLLIKSVKKGNFFYLDTPGAITTYVHVSDVARALDTLAFDPRAKNKIYNLSSDCTLEALVNQIAATLMLQSPSLRIPSILIRPPLIILSMLLKKWIHIPRLDALVLRTRYPSDKIESELGFVFDKPLPMAISAFISQENRR